MWRKRLVIAFTDAAANVQPTVIRNNKNHKVVSGLELGQAHPSIPVLEVTFSNGREFVLPAELLRVFSPAVNSSRALNLAGQKQVVHGRQHVGIMAVEAVGNYAVRLQFDDLHGSGLFTWPLLYDLGDNKRLHIRNYILQLRSQGLSRDPRLKAKAKAKVPG